MSDLATVVDWASPSDAEQRWNLWLDAHPASASSLDLTRDVVIDVTRTNLGDQRRYLVRRSAIRD